MADIKSIRKELSKKRPTKAFDKAVIIYANEILDGLEERGLKEYNGDTKQLLNGARSWDEASKGGDYLVYTDELRERLQDKKLPYDLPDKNLIGLQSSALAIAARLINEKAGKLKNKPQKIKAPKMKQPKVNNATLNKWAKGRC